MLEVIKNENITIKDERDKLFTLTGFKSLFSQFILWENKSFLFNKKKEMKEYIQWMEKTHPSKLPEIVLTAKTYDRLEIAPIWAIQFMEDKSWSAEIMENFIKTPNNVLSLFNNVSLDILYSEEYKSLMKNIELNINSMPEVTFVSKKQLKDLFIKTKTEETLKEVNNKMQEIASSYYNKFKMSFNIENNLFQKNKKSGSGEYKSEEEIIEILEKSTLMEFLNMMTAAIVAGVSKDTINLILINKTSAQTQIIPLKFFQTIYANYYVLCYEEPYDDIYDKFEKLKEIKKDPRYIGDILSAVLDGLFSKMRTLPGWTLGIQDVSGSMETEYDYRYPIYMKYIGYMMNYQFLRMSDKFSMILTAGTDGSGLNSNMKFVHCMNLNNSSNWDLLDFIVNCEVQHNKSGIGKGGIFTKRTFDKILEKQKNGEKIWTNNNSLKKSTEELLKKDCFNNVIVYSDSADSDVSYGLIKKDFYVPVANQHFLINVENKGCKCESHLQQWEASVENYSDYFLEFVFAKNGVASPSDKSTDSGGNPMRGLID